MTYRIYEVYKDNHYSLVKGLSEDLFPCSENWKYSIVEEYPTKEARDTAFLNLYLVERNNYFFIDYL